MIREATVLDLLHINGGNEKITLQLYKECKKICMELYNKVVYATEKDALFSCRPYCYFKNLDTHLKKST